MSDHFHLQVISPGGKVSFHELDPAQGLLNIGRHPDNDIILDDTKVADFQAIFYYQELPYELVSLSQTEQVSLVPDKTHFLQDSDTATLGDYTLILIAPDVAGTTAAPTEAATASEPTEHSEAITTSAAMVPVETFSPEQTPASESSRYEGSSPSTTQKMWATFAPPPDQTGPGPQTAGYPAASGAGYSSQLGRQHPRPTTLPESEFSAELVVDEQQVEVEQTAIYNLTINNDGNLYANFYISVPELENKGWEIELPVARVDKKTRETVEIKIAPPCSPKSRAGRHSFTMWVRSESYPGQFYQCQAALIVRPYYDFNVSGLSPKKQVARFSRSGRASISVTNRGNSHAEISLAGTDSKDACSFQFDVGDGSRLQDKEAQLVLEPEETRSIALIIRPHARKWLGLRNSKYFHTITTSLTGSQQAPDHQEGELRTAAFGLGLILLICLVLAILILQPRPLHFRVLNSTDNGRLSDIIINNNTPVALFWKAPFLTSEVKMKPTVEGIEQPLPLKGTAEAFPTMNITYTMSSKHFFTEPLGRLLPVTITIPFRDPINIPNPYSAQEKVVAVTVIPIPAKITRFETESNVVLEDSEIVLVVESNNADETEVYIRTSVVDDSIEKFSDPDKTIHVTPVPDQQFITYVAKAKNIYAPNMTAEKLLTITVVTPTPSPTPLPTPVIRGFNLPGEVTAGEAVIIDVDVAGADSVKIIDENGNIQELSSSGRATFNPQQTTEYTLIATIGGKEVELGRKKVVVNPAPTVTPKPTEPATPIIEYFVVTPEKAVQGEEVKLAWSVIGETTRIEINAGSMGVIPNLDPRGEQILVANANTFFSLTAYNGDRSASATAEMTVRPPPEPTITKVENNPTANTPNNTVRWDYDRDYRENINGFRIYRAVITQAVGFIPVSGLKSPDSKKFIDEGNAAIETLYYVVAIYTDNQGIQRETLPSKSCKSGTDPC